VERCKVVVDGVPVTDPEPDAEDDEPPVMWNGKEYWKVLGAESSVIWNPYVAKELVVGTLHVNFPGELEMLCAITGPGARWEGSAPWRRVMVMIASV